MDIKACSFGPAIHNICNLSLEAPSIHPLAQLPRFCQETGDSYKRKSCAFLSMIWQPANWCASQLLSMVITMPCCHYYKIQYSLTFFLNLDAEVIYNEADPQQERSTQVLAGYVLSHSAYPAKYGYNIDSSLKIVGLSHGQNIRLRFFSFDVKAPSYNGNCSGYDSLLVSGFSTTMYSFCNTNGHKPSLMDDLWFTVSGPEVKFQFRTNTRWNGMGFYLHYSGN